MELIKKEEGGDSVNRNSANEKDKDEGKESGTDEEYREEKNGKVVELSGHYKYLGISFKDEINALVVHQQAISWSIREIFLFAISNCIFTFLDTYNDIQHLDQFGEYLSSEFLNEFFTEKIISDKFGIKKEPMPRMEICDDLSNIKRGRGRPRQPRRTVGRPRHVSKEFSDARKCIKHKCKGDAENIMKQLFANSASLKPLSVKLKLGKKFDFPDLLIHKFSEKLSAVRKVEAEKSTIKVEGKKRELIELEDDDSSTEINYSKYSQRIAGLITSFFMNLLKIISL